MQRNVLGSTTMYAMLGLLTRRDSAPRRGSRGFSTILEVIAGPGVRASENLVEPPWDPDFHAMVSRGGK
jgi:hypothetical protein